MALPNAAGNGRIVLLGATSRTGGSGSGAERRRGNPMKDAAVAFANGYGFADIAAAPDDRGGHLVSRAIFARHPRRSARSACIAVQERRSDGS